MVGHVARRARMDQIASSTSCQTTPRSFSWTRTARQPAAMDARFGRSRVPEPTRPTLSNHSTSQPGLANNRHPHRPPCHTDVPRHCALSHALLPVISADSSRMANRRLNGNVTSVSNSTSLSSRNSVTRPKPSEEDEEKREMAEAAFREWLKRKAAEPHTPRASPSREQICLHLKEDARHRVYNNWFHSRRFAHSPQTNGETTPSSDSADKTISSSKSD